jgi:hypothetical protein
MADFKTYLYIENQDGEHEIEVRISYDASYQKEYISGPPEDCYPGDRSMDLTAVEPIGDLPAGITQEMLVVEAMAADERLTDEAWEHFHMGDE